MNYLLFAQVCYDTNQHVSENSTERCGKQYRVSLFERTYQTHYYTCESWKTFSST